MAWYDDIFRSVEDVWLVWLASCMLLYVFTRTLFKRVRRWNVRRLIREERGAGYSLGLVLIVPFYALLIATVVESTLMLVVKTGTTYAAYAAARAAIVWLPDERIPATDAPDYIPPANRRGMVHLAAINAMWPYASGSKKHTFGGPGAFAYDRQAARACVEAYRRYTSGKAPDDYLDRKWRYAAKGTTIQIERSSHDFNADLTVTVEYEMPLNVPGVGRFLGRRASWSGATYFTRKISSNATLEQEGPKSDNQSLGIAYYLGNAATSTESNGGSRRDDADDSPLDDVEDPEVREGLATVNRLIKWGQAAGYTQAAANLKNWRDASGDREIPASSFENEDFFLEHLAKKHRQKFIEGAIKRIKSGELTPGGTVEMEWTDSVNAPFLSDLFYALGGFTVHSKVRVQLAVDSDGNQTLRFTGWSTDISDIYNWDEGKATDIPLFGRISDRELLALEKAGYGKNFNVTSEVATISRPKITGDVRLSK